MNVRTRTWFGFVILASGLLIASSRFDFFDPLESAVASAVSPIESSLRSGTRPIADFVNNLTDVNRLSDENQVLREENERLEAENVRLAEAEANLRQIRQFFDIRDPREDDAFIAAAVVANDPNNVSDVIAIDQGRAEGLMEGMVVLTSEGSFIGSISRVLEHASWVTLITDQGSAVSAVIGESRVQGVVAGAVDGTLTMEFVQETADVEEGDLVLTSGIGGRHPAGELIGKVVNVEQAGSDLFQRVRVEPLTDLSRLEAVLVLSSFLPLETVEP